MQPPQPASPNHNDAKESLSKTLQLDLQLERLLLTMPSAGVMAVKNGEGLLWTEGCSAHGRLTAAVCCLTGSVQPLQQTLYLHEQPRSTSRTSAHVSGP